MLSVILFETSMNGAPKICNLRALDASKTAEGNGEGFAGHLRRRLRRRKWVSPTYIHEDHRGVEYIGVGVAVHRAAPPTRRRLTGCRNSVMPLCRRPGGRSRWIRTLVALLRIAQGH